MQKSIAACLLAALCVGHPVSGITFLSRDPTLADVIPEGALEGPGCRLAGESYITTGHSPRVDSLGEAKGKRTERDFAEDDAKLRVARMVAHDQDPQFDDDSHELTAEISGFQTAATYRIEGLEGMFLVGIVKKNAVHVRAKFDVAKARRNALAAFDVGDFSRAARLFAGLTQHGVQDAGTVGMAHAASAHLNLAAGIDGAVRRQALQELADFYYKRGDAEKALDSCYKIYDQSEAPERALLERLADLCSRTHRDNNAAAFQKEIARRWPTPEAR